MKENVMLVGINAKYIHSNLAVRYLKSYCRGEFDNISVMEFSINDHIDNIMKELYTVQADIYGFSCYIWNIELVLKACSSLKKAKPEAVIVLGGPEVSYDAPEIMRNNPFIDYIVAGEGEKTFLELLTCLCRDTVGESSIRGLCYRDGDLIVLNDERPLIPDLDEIPFPYEDFNKMNNKILYYETSRGCPMNCQYCLSSTIPGVRFLSTDRVRKDIDKFVKAGVKQVKLVDRTFNCNVIRSVEIMEYIISLDTGTNFHFEISADMLNEAFFETVGKAPRGLFQFEIGVQSTNAATLHEIKRKTDFEKLKANVGKLMEIGNSHIHLDLIAGLPYEDFESFKKSVNDVYSMKPHMLQLGFLKLLKGSGLRDNAVKYGIVFHEFPPYEVIKTSSISYEEILKLKNFEHVLELYYNSGRFRKTLDFLLTKLNATPFDFYSSLSDYWSSRGYYKSARGIKEQCTILYEYVRESFRNKLQSHGLKIFNEILKLDWLLYGRGGNIPSVIERYDHSKIKETIHRFIRDNIQENNAFRRFRDMTFREALKYISYEVFSVNVLDEAYPNEETVVFFMENPDKPSSVPDYFSISLKEIEEPLQKWGN